MASVAETAPAAAATATVSSSSIPRRNSGLSNAETKVLAGKLEEKYIANLVRSLDPDTILTHIQQTLTLLSPVVLQKIGVVWCR
jgi:hypothetical protein